MVEHRREWRELSRFRDPPLRVHSLRTLRWLAPCMQQMIGDEQPSPPAHSDADEHEGFFRQRRRALELMKIEIAWREKWWGTFGLLRTALFEPKAGGIQQPPGTRLARVFRFLLPRGVYVRYVEQVISDAQVEFIDAIAAGHEWHARWIAIRVWIIVIPGWAVGLAKWIIGLVISP